MKTIKNNLIEKISKIIQEGNLEDLDACPQASFEIFGEHEIYKLYRDLPRVSVLHPMSWQNYLAYTPEPSTGYWPGPLARLRILTWHGDLLNFMTLSGWGRWVFTVTVPPTAIS